MKPYCSNAGNPLGNLALAFMAVCPAVSLSAPVSGLRGAKPSAHLSLFKSKAGGPWNSYFPEYENPYQKDTHVARITDDLDPAAPASDFSESVTKFSDTNASPFSGLRDIPLDLHPDAFPEPYPDTNQVWSKYNNTDKRWKRLNTNFRCTDHPGGWTDRNGYPCGYYAKAEWCTGDSTEPGRGWKSGWGSFYDYKKDGVSAFEACCACGGGAQDVVVGQPLVPIEKRELFAPGDGLSLKYHPLLAPEDRFRPYPATAGADTVPKPTARYFDWEYKRSSEGDIPGLSAEYYVYPPPRLNAGESAYVTSRIYSVIDFEGNRPNYYQDLDWPAPFEKEPPVWWVRWTGSLRIMQAGNYTFDVDVGWDTSSKFFIDGIQLLTEGQCSATKTPGKCQDKGCTWCPTKLSCGTHESVCPPPPPQAPGPGPAPGPAASPAPAPAAAAGPASPPLPSKLLLTAEGHCVEIVVKVNKQRGQPRLKWKYAGPDTLENLQIVAANSLFCRPSIPACERPAIDACAKVKAE